MSAYDLIIDASIIVILSYLYNLIAKRFNIPSVLLLIATGIIINQLVSYFGIAHINWFPYLEVLGVVGLIMIVLEAALDLELKKEKLPLIGKSLLIAFVGLAISTIAAAFIILLLLPGFDWYSSLVYAMPLSVLSSAIVIPSVSFLSNEKKEFCIYESTLSDILGIMFFYFLISFAEPISNAEAISGFVYGLIITMLVSVVAAYGLIYIFQNVKSQVKTFLLIAILILLYAIGKQFHLSSLIIILFFGLVISNSEIFFPGFLKRTLKPESIKALFKDLHIVTGETAFIVRTFFFVIFGITIALESLWSIKVILVSVLILISIYGIRYLIFQLFMGKDIFPEVYIAPRGLITVLLFFAIPEELQVASFDNGILLFVIIATGIVMSWGMIRASNKSLDSEVMELLGELKSPENLEEKDDNNIPPPPLKDN
ncbi:MAG: cation:proton antiporter [Salibacteraceae bacterium]